MVQKEIPNAWNAFIPALICDVNSPDDVISIPKSSLAMRSDELLEVQASFGVKHQVMLMLSVMAARKLPNTAPNPLDEGQQLRTDMPEALKSAKHLDQHAGITEAFDEAFAVSDASSPEHPTFPSLITPSLIDTHFGVPSAVVHHVRLREACDS